MKILGIDYGRSKVGLSVSEGKLAEPYKVIRYTDPKDLFSRIEKEIEDNQIEKVVVGVSEGEMGKESEKFAKLIGAETFDETLSTYDAQRLSLEAGVSRKRRRKLEDAFAASVMLQSYLDNNV